MKLIPRYFNPRLANVPILYPLKTLGNQRFSGVFRGYKMGTLARKGWKLTYYIQIVYLEMIPLKKFKIKVSLATHS